MVKRLKEFYLLLAFVSYNTKLFSNIFLTTPKAFTNAEITALQSDREKNLTMDFTWSRGWVTAINYFQHSDKAGLAFKICGVPVYFYNYDCLERFKRFVSLFFNRNGEAQYAKNYYFSKPLKFNSPTPRVLQLEELAILLKGRKFVFYTGAGLSIAAGVPSMFELEKKLKLDRSVAVFLRAAILNPNLLSEAFSDFCKSALRAAPTPAHFALSKIAHELQIAILTENVDILQHKAGLEPLFSRSTPVWQATVEDFQQLDFIVCVGLSNDDCGLLAHYKKCNSKGGIIAINWGMPNYLAPDDYLLVGDLQVVLPQLVPLLTLDAFPKQTALEN